ncbi:MAG: lysylphosphatidylglycerol synthase transmembrane domain-containing protein [Crocinitomicaceae bacterium]|nr:lysylphosphatidylglycerol synthase transmembrane domain-containing protein [Crocinitomicaceae bacterium]
MLKTKQNQKNIFTFIKLILFVGVLGLVYWQVISFDKNAWVEFRLEHPVSLFAAVILVLPNIWFAYKKWSTTLNVVVPRTPVKKKLQSFFAGIVTGMLTPNMIGNFIGRFYYFKREFRSQIILFTLLSNYAQFLASLTFGWIAVLIVGDFYVIGSTKSFLIWLGIGVIIAYLVYFFIDNFMFRIRSKGYFKRFNEALKKHGSFRFKILGFSFARFFIFTLQYSLVLHAFGEPLSLYLIMAIWQVYLLTMIAPSLLLGKIGVREFISITILTGIGVNDFAVLFASLIIWFVNSLSPALVGLIICKKPSTDV